MHIFAMVTLMQSSIDSPRELKTLFDTINEEHFDSFLDPPVLSWNSRFSTCAGRFQPGSRKHWVDFPPKIEIAQYLLQEKHAELLLYNTLGHEMIHYWLWTRRLPHGHTAEFYHKMELMGVSRYNSAPRKKFLYLYLCQTCRQEYPAQKQFAALACEACCKKYAHGKFDANYALVAQKAPKFG
jgi:predicted SprT family Zn-dependent metalloprotease